MQNIIPARRHTLIIDQKRLRNIHVGHMVLQSEKCGLLRQFLLGFYLLLFAAVNLFWKKFRNFTQN